jgi:N-acetylneuraminate synthase
MKITEFIRSLDVQSSRLCRPYLIAEAGVNHEGDLGLAKRLIEEAKEGGADAIKFQTYKAEKLASRNSPSYWDTSKEPTKSQYQLFKKYDSFGPAEYEALKKHCVDCDIEFLSTPFDLASAQLLDPLVDAFKISSSDITNRPFIQHLGSYGKPIILSVGASYLHEIEEAISWLSDYSVRVSLLHCVLNYPTADKDAHLGRILTLRAKFPEHIIGYSDHTLPGEMQILETATLLGARILEKHFTHDKTLPGNDHYHAMDKADLSKFLKRIDRILESLGTYEIIPLENERLARRNARRSLVAAKDIPAGKKIESSDLTWKRPAFGISPKHIEDVIGLIARGDIPSDTVLTWDLMRHAE